MKLSKVLLLFIAGSLLVAVGFCEDEYDADDEEGATEEPPSRPQGPIKVLSTTKTSATIEWRAPEDDGGLPLSAYVLEKREFPRSTWSRVDKISPDMTSNTIQNLTTGSDYFFRVMAENKAGPSPPLEMDKPVRIKSPYDVPSAPTGLRVSNVTDKSADVSWTAPDSDGGTPITNYIVQTRIIPRSTFTTVQETTETKVTLTGLVADSQYMLQIIAVNAEGQSLPLQSREPICPEKILSVPDAPASLLIKNITKDGLTLKWTPPENDGGSRVRRYIIEKSLKGTDKWEKVTTVESFRTRCTVADLEREKDYFFAVSAENDVGIGEKQKTAKPVKMEKPIFPPSPPTGPLVISDVTKTSFKVTWKAPEKDGGSPVTHYSVEKRETWKTSWTLVERVPGDRLTCDLLLLQEGQDLVGVKAENVAGESKPLESEYAITPMSPYKKPSAPESLTATDVTETAVSLKWKPPTSDGGLPIKSYIVERRDKHWGSWVKAGTTKGTVTTLDVDGLVTGQEYYFRVSAENEEGVGPETEMKELVKPTREAVVPEPPTGPVYFSHLDATSVVLDWRAPRDDGGAPVLNYRIEVSQNQETWTEVTIVDGDLTKTKAKNLATDKKHYFRIFAINKVGTSKPLESDAVTPKRPVGPPGKPVGPLEAKAITRDSVQLDWKPPQDDGGLPITGYIIEKRDAGPTEDEDGVLVLSKYNFNDFIQDTETALVEFYAPWCGHCKSLAPEYAAAAKELKELDPPVLLAKVDATIESDLAQEQEVSGYPTLKFFKNGKSFEYDGPRNQAGIVAFMKTRASPDWKPDPEAVVVLTKENFADTINTEELALVEFYAPWCGHCKALAPKYEKAAKILKASPEPIVLGKVDATQESELAKEYGVTGYPTLKIFRKGEAFDYNGPREERGIVEYMNKQRGEPAKPVDKAALKFFLQEEDISVLAFFDDEKDPRLRIYQDALHDIRDDYHVGYTTDKALFKQYKANPGSVLVLNSERFYTKFEPKWHIFDIKEDTKSEEIKRFILDHQFPLVGYYDGSVNKRYADQSPLCIVFYTVDWSFDFREVTQMWRHKIADIAKDYKDIRFAVANDDTNQELLKDFGLEDSPEEMNIGIIADGKKFPMEPMEEFDSDHIKEFLDNFKKGKIAPHIKSQPVPKKQGLVKVVVGKTFQQIVMDKSKDVLIELYAPWCGHCKKLEPIYKDLAKKFKPAKDLVIAKLDATANDVPDEYQAGGFPTIYFAPTNKKNNPIKYEGGREVDDFVKFLKTKATVSLGSLKDEL